VCLHAEELFGIIRLMMDEGVGIQMNEDSCRKTKRVILIINKKRDTKNEDK
jgi:hypothetical protein